MSTEAEFLLAAAKLNMAANAFCLGATGNRRALAQGDAAENIAEALCTACAAIEAASPHRLEAIRNRIVKAFTSTSNANLSAPTAPALTPIDGGRHA